MNARAHGEQLLCICWVAAGIAPQQMLLVGLSHPIVCLFHPFSFVGGLCTVKLMQLLFVKHRFVGSVSFRNFQVRWVD